MDARRAPDALSLRDELSWAAAFLLRCQPVLRRHVEAVKPLEVAIVASDWQAAADILAEHSRDCGASLWEIKNNLLLIGGRDGLEPLKKYAASFSRRSSRSIVAYVAHHASVRNEEKVGPDTFEVQFRDTVQKLAVSERLRLFVTYHVVPMLAISEAGAVAALSFEANRSAVDLYEAVLFACRVVVALDLADSMPRRVFELAQTFGDERMANALVRIDPTRLAAHIPAPSDATLRAFERCLRGDPASLQDFSASSYDEAFIDGAARTTESATGVAFFDLASAMLTAHSAEAADTAKKLFLNAPWSAKTSWLAAVARRATSDALFARDDDLLAFAVSTATPFALTSIEVSDPGLYVALREADARYDLAQRCALGHRDPQFVSEVALTLQINALVQVARFDEALQLSESSQLSSPERSRELVRLKATALLKNRRLSDAIDYFATSMIADNELARALPLRQLLGQSVGVVSGRELARAVVVEFALRSGVLTEVSARLDVYEDFLASVDAVRPSELLARAVEFPRRLLVFFMAEICVENVMDLAPLVFSTSSEVIEERQRLCHGLMTLDPGNADRYQAELRAIIKRLAIKKRIRQIEQSKVYVDLDSIRRLAHATLRQSFERYRAFLREGADRPVETVLAMSLEGETAGGTTLIVPKSEVGQLFVSMLSALLDEFLWSGEHGLDWYLSVRIRHGTLEGQLRRPFELARLITRRDAATGDYAANDHWLARFGDNSTRDELGHALADFSRGVDDLIREITSEWIQIRRTEMPNGLLEMGLTLSDLIALVGKLDAETSFDEFVDYALDHYRERLANHLDVVRRRFVTEAKTRVRNLVIAAEAAFERLGVVVDCAELNGELRRAHTEMQTTLDRVADWLKLGRAVEYDDFKIDEAIETSSEMVRMVCASFDSAVATIGDKWLVHQGSQFTNLVDIFFIVFDNAVRHSGMGAASTANVTVAYKINEMNVTIRTPIRPDVATAEARDRVERLRSIVSAGSGDKRLAREGGTGFLKIAKILRHDFNSTNLRFGFDGNDAFVVSFSVRFHG